MKVAVFADIHENFHNLSLALDCAKEKGASKILVLGDLMNGGIAKVLAGCAIPVFMIWGNNDGDKVAITTTSLQPESNLTVAADTFAITEIDGKKLFLTHYPLLAKPMAKSGDFDAVFYGHSHEPNIDSVGSCIIINPGEISAHKTGVASIAIYDTATNTAEIIILEGSITLKTERVKSLLENMKFKMGSPTHKY